MYERSKVHSDIGIRKFEFVAKTQFLSRIYKGGLYLFINAGRINYKN